MTKKGLMRLFWILSVVFLSIMSSTFLFMPMAVNITNVNRQIHLIIVGCFFWFSFILGYISWVIAYLFMLKVKKQFSDYKKVRKFVPYSNTATCIFDTCFIIALVSFCILVFLNKTDIYWEYLMIFAIVLTFNLHGLFSCETYKRYIEKERV